MLMLGCCDVGEKKMCIDGIGDEVAAFELSRCKEKYIGRKIEYG